MWQKQLLIHKYEFRNRDICTRNKPSVALAEDMDGAH
jgi:hypothetical protein